MADPIYPLEANPQYDENIRALQDTDPARATTGLNPVFTKALNNTHRVKKDLDALKKSVEGPGGAANITLANGTTVEKAITDLDAGKAGLDPVTHKVKPEQLPPMDYDPTGTAAGLLTTHDANGSAHNDIRVAVSTAQSTADAAKSIAEGRSRGVVYANYAALVAALNGAVKTGFKLGDNLLVISVGVPDLWISEALTAATPYNYTTDEALILALGTTGSVQMGYFKVSQLEGEKVDLTGYVKTSRKVNGKPLTADISLGAADVGARASGNVPEGEVTGIFPVSKGGTGLSSLTAGHILVGNGTGGVELKAPGDFAKYVGLAYGVCSSSGSSKTVSVPGFQLITGARIAVTFSYDVGSSPTLNVSSTGAKYIQWQGSNLFGGIIGAGDTAELVYTGSYWYLLAVDKVAAGSITFADASWATIGAIAQAGLAQSFWLKGDKKNLTLTTGEIITMRLEDFNHDTLTSGGKASLSLIMENGLKTTRNMNGSNTNVGGWGSSEMRSWMSNTLFGQLPSDLQAVIKSVNKLTSAGNNSPSIVTSSDKLWLPSYTEVGFAHNPSYSPGGEGSAYPLFISDASRIKTVNGSANYWWLRSPYATNTTIFDNVYSDGSYSSNGASSTYAVAAGFCI